MRAMINGLTIETRLGDIAQVEADAIVNPANTGLIMGSGVAGALLKAGGPTVQQSVAGKRVPLGEAIAGTAGLLHASWVIHAATVGLGTYLVPSAVIEDATHNALLRAADKGARSIAFPAMGAGVGGVVISAVAEAMFRAFVHHSASKSYPSSIICVLFRAADLAAFDAVFLDWRQTIRCTCGAVESLERGKRTVRHAHRYWCPSLLEKAV